MLVCLFTCKLVLHASSSHTKSQLCKPGNLNSRKKVRLVKRSWAESKPKESQDSTPKDCAWGGCGTPMSFVEHMSKYQSDGCDAMFRLATCFFNQARLKPMYWTYQQQGSVGRTQIALSNGCASQDGQCDWSLPAGPAHLVWACSVVSPVGPAVHTGGGGGWQPP